MAFKPVMSIIDVTPDFIDAVAEFTKTLAIKLRWLVPPLKSLSLGQGYWLPEGVKLREAGMSYSSNEAVYMANALLIDPREYIRLPSHLAEMARVDKFASLCGTTRDNPLGIKCLGQVLVDYVPIFVTSYKLNCGFKNYSQPEQITYDKYMVWMNGGDSETFFFKDGAISDYSGGLRSGSYWGWPLKYDGINKKYYYDPKTNPRSADDVEAILKGLASGKITNQPTAYHPYLPPPPVVPQKEKKPTNTVITPRNKSMPVAKPVPKRTFKRNTIVPIALPKSR